MRGQLRSTVTGKSSGKSSSLVPYLWTRRGGSSKLVRLTGHRPHCDDVSDDEDERDDHRRLQQAGAASLTVAQPVDADPTERERQEEEHSTPVGDDESDPQPGG